VAKRYDRHTIFETGVVDATPATPLPAPLIGARGGNEVPRVSLKRIMPFSMAA